MNTAIHFFFVTIGTSLAQRTGRPEIYEGPRSQEVSPGSTVLLRCRTSLPVGTYPTWQHNGRDLPAFMPRHQLPDGTWIISSSDIQLLADGSLSLANVKYSSQGTYTCTASSEDGVKVVSPAAQLLVRDRNEKPRITHRPVRTTVEVGGLIMLDCLASGYPPPTYTWFKDGGRLSSAHDRFTLATNGSLIITNAQTDDTAHYRCSASNYLGKASSSARVKVERAEPYTAPRISTVPRSKSVQEGGIVEMTCIAQGSPYPDISWWNNRRLVTGSSRVTISNGGQHLRIQDIEVYDQGDYTCVAENSLGREQVTAAINVIADPAYRNRNRLTRLQRPVGALGSPQQTAGFQQSSRAAGDDGQSTPAFGQGQWRQPSANTVARPHDSRAANAATFIDNSRLVNSSISGHSISATIGSTVLLPCPIQRDDEDILWYKNGQLVPFDSSHRMASDGSLFLYRVDPRDEGDYECMMIKDRERRTAPVSFRVLSAPVVESDVEPPARQDVSRQSSQPAAASFQRPRAGQPITGRSRGGRLPTSTTERYLERRHDTDLSYDVSGGGLVGDDLVRVSIERARSTVDRALNTTVEILFHHHQHTNRTPVQLLNIFRFPSGSERELARAGEIYHRTLELVAAKVKEGENYNLSTFSTLQLISPANLELIANLSGCEANRREADCEDICFHSKYRSADGSCNNWNNPLWGASLTSFHRLLPPQYENGFNTPIGHDPERLYNGYLKPNPRTVSTRLISTRTVTPDPILTHMTMQWGQFLDHDIDHSLESISRQTFGTGQTCSSSCSAEPPCFPILLPPDDPRNFTEVPIGGGAGGRDQDGRRCIELTRSSAACGSGTTAVFFDRLQQREQVNQLTSFIDASQVYGSTADLANSLRNISNDFGRLREGLTHDYGKPLLPFNDGHPIDCRRDPRESSTECFLAGDIRLNEHLGLLAMHTIWFREHNRLAEALRLVNPHWPGDKIYQEARKIVGALVQHITYKHWLPNIIGPEGMAMLGRFSGYDPSANPSVANVFATAAFRFGHTMVNPRIRRLSANLTSIPEGDLPLHKAFFAPWRLTDEGGVDPILRGLFAAPAKMASAQEGLNSDLTERLFEVAHVVALDLAAINIQRGRDHALPPYTEWLKYCQLGDPTSWQDLKEFISDQDKLAVLEELYGHPDNVDLFVGAVLEDKVEAGRVGPTTRCLLVEQFTRLRDGDRFWYENPGVFTADQLAHLKQVTLSSLLCDNGDDIRKVPRDVFHNTPLEEMVPCSQIPQLSVKPWADCEYEEEVVSEFFAPRQRREAANTAARYSRAGQDGGKHADDLGKLLQLVGNLEEKIKELESRLTNEEDSGICLTTDGSTKQNGDHWTVQASDSRCLSCLCQAPSVICREVTCS